MRMLEISVISLMYAIRDYLESMGRKQPALFMTLINQAIEVMESDKYTVENLRQEIKELQRECADARGTVEHLQGKLDKVTNTVTDTDLANFASAWNSKSGSPLAFSQFWTADNEAAIHTIIKYAKGAYKIQAIKELRGLSGIGLREAKETIEQFAGI
jgi:ribosomal protein L7/L12